MVLLIEHRPPFGKYPVYCQTSPDQCIGADLFLGYKPLNTPIRCEVCGRFSVAAKIKNDVKIIRD